MLLAGLAAYTVASVGCMSRGLTGLGVIACLCAPLGGLVSDLFGWRYALLLLALFGAGSLGLVALRFEERLLQCNRDALRARVLVHTWRLILRHPTFGVYAALSSASYAGCSHS